MLQGSTGASGVLLGGIWQPVPKNTQIVFWGAPGSHLAARIRKMLKVNFWGASWQPDTQNVESDQGPGPRPKVRLGLKLRPLQIPTYVYRSIQ